MADTTFGLQAGTGALSEWGEQQLILALRRNEESAYETLIVAFQQPVYNLIFRLMNDSADAADITQEVFLKVFRNIGSFRATSTLKTWVYRIAVNEAYNHRRWRSRHHRQETPFSGNDEGAAYCEASLADPGRSPFELAADSETRHLVEAALAELSPKFRTAVVLRDIEDLNYDEIASILDVSLGTVKSRIVRGREALRKRLELRLEGAPMMKLSPLNG